MRPIRCRLFYMDLAAELRDVVGALAAQQIPYALAGGLAVAVWGAPRATKDIDLLIEESSLVSALRPESRLDAKLDMSPEGIARRIKEASDLNALCELLGRTKAGSKGASKPRLYIL
jgi:hypothetical protein